LSGGGDGFSSLLETTAEVVRRRAQWLALAPIAPGMVEALVAAEILRPSARESLRAHYGGAMPALLARQLRAETGVERAVFGTPLRLARMPRLASALEALYANVAGAGLSCARHLGAPTPRALVEGRTLSEVYAGCHFGGSMPMLYAYPADLSGAGEGEPLALIDSTLVGPLVHELSHLRTQEPPAPANVHEGLAASIGSAAWPAQICPEHGELDAIPGAGWFAALGAWIARAIGERDALRVQAGVLELREALGPAGAEALRLYGFLPFLERGAPHLLADAFHPARWWKLIDLHRDPALASGFHRRLAEPLLAGGPAREGEWNDALDALAWRDLPSWRDAPCDADERLASIARRSLRARTVRKGQSFKVAALPQALALTVDADACELRAPFDGLDALGAPPEFPFPPALCARTE